MCHFGAPHRPSARHASARLPSRHTSALCLLDDPDRIVPVSRELAETLHQTMTAPAIKPGVLASVVGAFDKPQKFVALLKLDESTNFKARTNDLRDECTMSTCRTR